MKPIKEMSIGELAAYYHWNDKQCLDQAIMITEVHPFDIEEIRRWSENEGKLEGFNKFKSKVIHVAK